MENHDIEDLVNGKGVLNWEHSNKGEDIIGAVIYAHKILDKKDCENDRQRKYWDFVKKPFVYIIGELFEDEEHPGAIAVAAMIRYYAKKGEKLLTGFSIEGATLERRDYILQESVGRRVAVTLRPCNHTAIAGLYEDPKAKKIAKDIEKMAKSVDETLVEIDSIILEDEFMPADPILDLYKAMADLEKTLEAGMGNVAPGQLTGGAALQREHITGFQRNRLKAVVRDWNRKRPLREVIKAALPEVSDEYLNHFEEVAEELALKKSSTNKLIRLGASHAHSSADDEQKKLTEGVYLDPAKKYDVPHGSYNSGAKMMLRGRNDAGQDVLMKWRHNNDKHVKVNHEYVNKQHTNAHHHFQLMKDVFGLRNHVPAVAMASHPQVNEGNGMQIQEYIKGSRTPLESDTVMAKAKKKHAVDGHIHKLVIANHILGVADRHNGNVVVHPKGHLMSIDHDDAFQGWSGGVEPDLIYGEEGNDSLHPEAAKWLKGLDARQLAGKMLDQGHDPATIKTSLSGLKYYQRLADRPDMSIGQMFDHAANHMTAVNAQERQGKKAV